MISVERNSRGPPKSHACARIHAAETGPYRFLYTASTYRFLTYRYEFTRLPFYLCIYFSFLFRSHPQRNLNWSFLQKTIIFLKTFNEVRKSFTLCANWLQEERRSRKSSRTFLYLTISTLHHLPVCLYFLRRNKRFLFQDISIAM